MPTSFNQIYSRYRGYFSDILALYRQKPDLKRFLELFLSLAAVTVFSLFAIKPTVITIVGLVKEIKAKENTILLMDIKINNLKTAQNVYYQNKAAIEILNSAIPDSPAPDLAARQIEAIVANSSVYPDNISYSSATIKGKDDLKRSKAETEGLPEKAKAVTVSLGGKGEFDPIKNLISNLENARRPFKIDTATVSKNTLLKEGEESNLVFSISGRIPYYSNE